MDGDDIMTEAPNPGMVQEHHRGLSPLMLVLVLVAVVVIAAGIGFVAATTLQRVSVDLRYSVDAGSRVGVSVPDARLVFHPGTDKRVHVTVSGWHTGGDPHFTVRTIGDTTSVEGRCDRLWFARCSITVDVSLPTSARVGVTGVNGDVRISGLNGALRVATTNGAVDLSDVRGPLDLRTVNGSVRLEDGSSHSVRATTTNGAVELGFVKAPERVEAQTTNGSVSVALPRNEDYRIDARTVNGRVDTREVPSRPDARRTVTVRSVNGSVTVEHAAG